ncbi:MAG TPA: translocation/assembly module TamB domain-containing protein [Kofleriaceae bacterium]
MNKKRIWRWTKRITLGVIAFAIFATAVTLGVLHTNWGRNRLRIVVEDQLKSQFPGSTIGRVDGSVLGDLILRDITIMGRDKRPLATVKTLKLEAALLPLAGKTAHVKSITADGVVVYVHDQGPAPEQPPSSGASEPSSWSVELPVIAVNGGRIEIETASGVEKIENLAAKLSLSLRAGEPMIASVHAQAAFRGEPIYVTAIASQGDELAVPFAVAALGDARVIALDSHIDGTKLAGVVSARASAALVKKLAQVELPGDAAVLAKLSKSGALELDAQVGVSSAKVLAKLDLETLVAHAIVAAEVPDVSVLAPTLAGHGTVVATVIASPERIDGMVAVSGATPDVAGTTLLAVGATPDHARLVIAGAGAGSGAEPPRRQSRQDQKQEVVVESWALGGSVSVQRAHDQWTLTESMLRADATTSVGFATASLAATGALTPEPSIAVTGTVDGRAIRYDDLSIASAHVRLAATEIPKRPTGTAQIDVNGVKQGTFKVPFATLAARGVMHEDGVIDIDLERHRIRTADKGEWAGNGGHVRVTETSIVATQLATTSGPSKITAQATIGRTTDMVVAKASAREVAVAMFDPTLTGTLAADIDVARQGGLWKGTATVDATQIVIPKQPIVDGKLAIKIDKRRVTATATASNPAIGSATVDLDVIGPRDITDVLAWQRLERNAIQRIRVALANVDASKLGASGKLDGELAVGALDAGGTVDVKGVVTDVGTLDSQLALAPGPNGEIAAHGTLHLGGVDPVSIDAVIALPIHPFDPTRWQQLGRETLRRATIEAKRIAFDPALLSRFGVADSPWRGWAAVKLDVGAGARSSEFVVDVHELRGGPLHKPLDLHITGGSDAKGPHFDATVKTDKLTFTLTGKSPLSIESMIAGNARDVPIEGTVNVPPSSAREIGLLIGRDDVLAGTVAGKVQITGTVGEPTGRASLSIDNLSVAAGIATKPPTLDKLDVDARWLGMTQGFEFELTGHEAGGRLLKISARGKPDSPETIIATIEASNFDIAPFLAFAPPNHPAVGMRGLVSGVLKLRGLDPNTGDVRGRLVVSNARIPLAPELGTLRSGQFEIDVVKKTIVTTIDGKIGRGTIKGKAVMRLTGSMPTTAELTLALRKVSPIGEIQPVIDADIKGLFTRGKTKWNGQIDVKNGNVFVPPEGGNELITAGGPGDIVFIDKQKLIVKAKRRPPTAPWLVARVDVGRTKILVDDVNFRFDGAASGQLKLELGDGIGLDGALSTERGIVDVLGRRYRLDHGIVDFDGTLDPRLDIEMAHSFRTMTLTVQILGRSSAPDLRLTSDSGGYNQGQLLNFLAGATPSDDPSASSGDAVAGGGLTILSSRIGRKINKRLPLLKFDSINYEAKTASTSRAIKLGKQLNDRTYLSFRNRFEPRPDENPREAQIDYDVRKNVVLQATGGERGAGADLLWRKRW